MSHRLVFSWLFEIWGNLGNAKEKAKWRAWPYASTLQNVARWHFFEVNGVSIEILWERDVETGENMWKVLKRKAWA